MILEAREQSEYRRQAEVVVHQRQLDTAKANFLKANEKVRELEGKLRQSLANETNAEDRYNRVLGENEALIAERNAALEKARESHILREQTSAKMFGENRCVQLTKRLLDKTLHQWLEDASNTGTFGEYVRCDSDTEAALAECEVNIQGVLAKLRAARNEWTKRSVACARERSQEKSTKTKKQEDICVPYAWRKRRVSYSCRADICVFVPIATTEAVLGDKLLKSAPYVEQRSKT